MEDLLSRLDLERFVSKFHAEEVDFEALSLFEEGDLLDLGVPKGPRIKLLRALHQQSGSGGGADGQGGAQATSGEQLALQLQATKQLESMALRMEQLEKQVSSAEKLLWTTCSELSDVAKQQAKHDERLEGLAAELAAESPMARKLQLSGSMEGNLGELATDLCQDEPEAEGPAAPSELKDEDEAEALEKEQGVSTLEFQSLVFQFRELSKTLIGMQELSPSTVCWTIRRAAEKASNIPPGTCLKSQQFVIAGVVGLRMEFYPASRGRPPDKTDERSLPVITPRGPAEDAQKEKPVKTRGGRLLPAAEEGLCTLGISAPMGVKLQYRVQIGSSFVQEESHVQQRMVYHDAFLHYREDLDEEGSLHILVTAVRLHNKSLPVHAGIVNIVAP
eukprot:TRINITY_DN101754_c0_g1_i1.p1 TRINITY_DN101754_c0_g1~~TRINITY_DN101754_c0_g1_i1.p1  ORF type:complete len:390 (+),score=135.56 TRINITY_DN101754_c0_g1_i1:34-1203(+)